MPAVPWDMVYPTRRQCCVTNKLLTFHTVCVMTSCLMVKHCQYAVIAIHAPPKSCCPCCSACILCCPMQIAPYSQSYYPVVSILMAVRAMVAGYFPTHTLTEGYAVGMEMRHHGQRFLSRTSCTMQNAAVTHTALYVAINQPLNNWSDNCRLLSNTHFDRGLCCGNGDVPSRLARSLC